MHDSRGFNIRRLSATLMSRLKRHYAKVRFWGSLVNIWGKLGVVVLIFAYVFADLIFFWAVPYVDLYNSFQEENRISNNYLELYSGSSGDFHYETDDNYSHFRYISWESETPPEANLSILRIDEATNEPFRDTIEYYSSNLSCYLIDDYEEYDCIGFFNNTDWWSWSDEPNSGTYRVEANGELTIWTIHDDYYYASNTCEIVVAVDLETQKTYETIPHVMGCPPLYRVLFHLNDLIVYGRILIFISLIVALTRFYDKRKRDVGELPFVASKPVESKRGVNSTPPPPAGFGRPPKPPRF